MIELLKFFARFLKHLLIFVCVLIPLQIVSAVLLPFVLPFYRGPLPRALRWFDNADQFNGRDTSVYKSVIQQGIRYQYYWLVLRNPLNYFGYFVLGLTINANFTQRILHNAPDGEVGDATNCVPGLFYTEVEMEGKTYYEYYYIKTYTIGSTVRCLRVRIGHKFGDDVSYGQHTQFVGLISPWHSYSGRV